MPTMMVYELHSLGFDVSFHPEPF